MSELASKTIKEGQKLLPEELSELVSLQEGFRNLNALAGNIAIQKLNLQQDEKELESNFILLRKNNSEFLQGLSKKYGPIDINIETGEYIQKQLPKK